MKISKFTENGFKGMPKIDMDLPKTIFVTGNNGAGKTSFIDALNFALTGNSPEEDIVNKAEGKACISIVLESGDVVTREKSSDNSTVVKYNGRRCTIKALNEAISNSVGIPMESLKIASSSEAIESMSPAEFSDFITKYLPENIPVDSIIALMDDAEPDAIEHVCAQLGESATFADINKAYALFYEKRKDAKRKFDVSSGALQKLDIPEGFTPDADALKEAEKKYYEKRDLAAKYEAQKKTAEKEAAEYEKQKKIIKDLETEISTLADASEPDKAQKTRLEAEKEDVEKQIIAARTTSATLEQNSKALSISLANISKPTCPLSDKVTCKNVEDKQKIKDEIEAAIEAAKAGRKLQSELIATLTAKKEEISSQLSAYIKNEQNYVRKTSLEKQLGIQKKNMIEVQEMPEEPDIANIGALKTAYESLKKQNDDYVSYTKLKAEAEAAKHDVTVYDYLVKAFQPKGKIASSTIDKYLFNFTDICNETASMIKPGMEMKFIAEGGIKVLCRMPGKEDFLPFKNLSSGEKILEVLILMDLISQLTGTGILSLDNLEQLDEGTFQELMDAVGMLEDRYDHIILSCVKHNDLLAVAQNNGLKILNLS